jgi:hypothetical protein
MMNEPTPSRLPTTVDLTGLIEPLARVSAKRR